MNLTNTMLNEKSIKRNVLYDSIDIKLKRSTTTTGKTNLLLEFPAPGRRSNGESPRVTGNILFLDLGADYTDVFS